MAHNQLDTTYIEPLTKRELEVLELLASGASNQEIAAALVVEVTTAKWYNAQIYGKLQVKNRKEAVVRAQTLGIIKTNDNNFFQIQHKLPADAFPFVGRVREIHELVQQLTNDKYRLITILGPGGMGKTRLAIEVGRKLIPHFRDGVYFVPLAPVTVPELIVTILAEIIGFKFHGDKQPKLQLLEHFQKQHMLLIIDNFEHLVDYADFLSEILYNAPDTKILVTSRERLNLAGEMVHLLSGLSLPFEDETQTIVDYDAVKLFIESALRIGLELNDSELVVVARICQLLGGMPLAILLAAAWVDTLSIVEIEAEIRAGLGILEANLRDAPLRHHSIQAAFDTSWKQLTTNEQAIFMRLSVFRGGFIREAAQKITGASVRDLQRLVQTSFIQLLPSGRYALHELMRQYGEQKLKASGELDTTHEQHAQFFTEFITPLGAVPVGTVTDDMLKPIGSDFENVRAAWLFQVENKNITELRRMLDGIWLYCSSQEGVDLFEPLLTLFQDSDDDTELLRGQVLARLAWWYNDVGRGKEALALGEEALSIVQSYDVTNDILLACAIISIVYWFAHQLEQSREFVNKGYELCVKTGNTRWLPTFYFFKGDGYAQLGEYQRVLDWFQSMSSYHSFLLRGYALTRLGNYDEAEEYLLEALRLSSATVRYSNSRGYCYLIDNAVLAEDYERAWVYTQRALHYVDTAAYAWVALEVLGYVLPLLIAEQQYEKAVEILSLIMNHHATLERTRTMRIEQREALKTHLADEFEAAWERGKQLDLGDVITEYMER